MTDAFATFSAFTLSSIVLNSLGSATEEPSVHRIDNNVHHKLLRRSLKKLLLAPGVWVNRTREGVPKVPKADYKPELTPLDHQVFSQLVPEDHYLRRLKAAIDFSKLRSLFETRAESIRQHFNHTYCLLPAAS
jgi:hypothetical protein